MQTLGSGGRDTSIIRGSAVYSVWVNCLLAEDTETSPCQTGSKFDSFCDSYQTYHANMPVTIPSVFYTQYAWDMSGTFKPKESFYNH